PTTAIYTLSLHDALPILHDFHEFLTRNIRAGNKSKRFGKRVHLQREDQVHRQLDGLTGPVWAQVKPFLAHDTKDGFHVLKRTGVAANHEKQLTLFCAPIAARDWRVQKMHPAFRASRGDLAG